MYYLPSYNSKSCIEDNAFDDDTDLLSRVKPSQVKVSETAPGFVRAFSHFSLISSINQGIIARNKKNGLGSGPELRVCWVRGSPSHVSKPSQLR